MRGRPFNKVTEFEAARHNLFTLFVRPVSEGQTEEPTCVRGN